MPLDVKNNCANVNGSHGASKSCGYLGTDATAAMYRQQAEVLQLPIWQASTALYPSIYLPVQYIGQPVSVAAAYIESTVVESVKVAAMAAAGTSHEAATTPIPVFPYAWDHYHSGIHTLPKSSLVANLNVSMMGGVDQNKLKINHTGNGLKMLRDLVLLNFVKIFQEVVKSVV